MEIVESKTRGPGNETRGPTNDTGASKRHITGDRSTQAGAKRSIDPTSAFGLRPPVGINIRIMSVVRIRLMTTI